MRIHPLTPAINRSYTHEIKRFHLEDDFNASHEYIADPRLPLSGLAICVASMADDISADKRIGVLTRIAGIAYAWAYSLGVKDPWQAMRDEYDRAKEKHGDKTFDNPEMGEDLKYYALMEEVGEIARALTYDREHAGELVDEIIQVGALALAWATTYLNQKTPEGETA